MINETMLDQSPMWLLYGGTVLLLLTGSELGFRVGTRHRARAPEGEKAPANAMMGATLGLLAFMLAFTFGMSSTRFDARKQLVLEEASAIMVSLSKSPAPSGAPGKRMQPVAARLSRVANQGRGVAEP